MLSARLVNVFACRTYAVLAACFALLYGAASSTAFYWSRYGVPSTLLGQPLPNDPFFAEFMLPKLAWDLLAFGLVYIVLATFAWKRYVWAIIVCFAIWVLPVGQRFVSGSEGLAGHAIEAIGILVLALVMAASIVTRRGAEHPTQPA